MVMFAHSLYLERGQFRDVRFTLLREGVDAVEHDNDVLRFCNTSIVSNWNI